MKRLIVFLFLFSVVHGFIASGEATVSSVNGFNRIGFYFVNGSVSGNDGDFYYFDGELWTNGPYGLISVEGNVSSCDLNGYVKHVRPVVGGFYCVKANDGSFAKIKVVSLTDDSLTFKWFHQRDGSNLFIDRELVSTQEVSFDWFLIWIIIFLIIVLFIVWRFR